MEHGRELVEAVRAHRTDRQLKVYLRRDTNGHRCGRHWLRLFVAGDRWARSFGEDGIGKQDEVVNRQFLPPRSRVDTGFAQGEFGRNCRADEAGKGGCRPADVPSLVERCRELGFELVAHAGEEGPAAYIETALDVLQVRRIDHGVRCTESPALVERLARERVPLTVCPLSNIKLCVFPHMARHNLPALLAAGLCVTVNSDDPAYFGGYLNQNFLALFEALPELGAPEAWQLAANSFEASFVDDTVRADWRLSLDEVFRAAAQAG